MCMYIGLGITVGYILSAIASLDWCYLIIPRYFFSLPAAACSRTLAILTVCTHLVIFKVNFCCPVLRRNLGVNQVKSPQTVFVVQVLRKHSSRRTTRKRVHLRSHSKKPPEVSWRIIEVLFNVVNMATRGAE